MPNLLVIDDNALFAVARAVTRLDRQQAIALRLGQLREFRVYFPEDLKPAEKRIWPELRRNNLVSSEDETIRNCRSITAHFYSRSFESLRKVGSGLDSREVLQSFEYKLDSLIGPLRRQDLLTVA